MARAIRLGRGPDESDGLRLGKISAGDLMAQRYTQAVVRPFSLSTSTSRTLCRGPSSGRRGPPPRRAAGLTTRSGDTTRRASQATARCSDRSSSTTTRSGSHSRSRSSEAWAATADGAYECAVDLVAVVGVARQVHAVRGRAAGAGGAAKPRRQARNRLERQQRPRRVRAPPRARGRLRRRLACLREERNRTRRSSGTLALLEVEPEDAAMVGDSYEDDIEGAGALGLRTFLIDREGRHPAEPGRLTDLYALPAALGLTPRQRG